MPNDECRMNTRIHQLPFSAPGRSRDVRHSAFGIRHSAFTLIEILVVLGIVTLIAALGVPVYNALSGSRSVEAAQNQVAAYIGQARTIAINEGKTAGVLFYVDPATERTAMAIVLVGDTTLEDPDPYEKYKAWMPGVTYNTGNLDPNNDGNTSDRTRADRVIGMISDANSAFDASSYPASVTNTYTDPRRYIGNFRPAVKLWRAERTNTSSNTAGNRPPRAGPGGSPRGASTITTYSAGLGNASESTDGKYGNATWVISSGKVISQYSQSEQQLLPKGIGLQVIIQPTSRSNSNVYADRYVRTGIVLFDPQGRLVLRDMTLPKTTTLGGYLDLQTDAIGLLSGVGVALYNDTQFRAYSNNGLTTSQADWVYGGGAGNTYFINSTSPALTDYPTSVFNDEQSEENWLANNTVPIMVNRFSGSLSETE